MVAIEVAFRPDGSLTGVELASSKHAIQVVGIERTVSISVPECDDGDRVAFHLSENVELVSVEIEEWLVQQKRLELMTEGVTFKLPETCYIEDNVKIGRDTVIGPNCAILGGTVIGSNCVIGANSVLEDQNISDGQTLKPGTILSSQ